MKFLYLTSVRFVTPTASSCNVAYLHTTTHELINNCGAEWVHVEIRFKALFMQTTAVNHLFHA